MSPCIKNGIGRTSATHVTTPWEECYPVVLSVARQLAPYLSRRVGMEKDDLVNDAYLWLFRPGGLYEKYDPARGSWPALVRVALTRHYRSLAARQRPLALPAGLENVLPGPMGDDLDRWLDEAEAFLRSRFKDEPEIPVIFRLRREFTLVEISAIVGRSVTAIHNRLKLALDAVATLARPELAS